MRLEIKSVILFFMASASLYVPFANELELIKRLLTEIYSIIISIKLRRFFKSNQFYFIIKLEVWQDMLKNEDSGLDGLETEISSREPQQVRAGNREFWSQGAQLLDEYVVRKVLGKGGMGIVYLVETIIPPAQLFAVKTILASGKDVFERRKMFFRELRVWIDLPDHPNIVTCYFCRTVRNRFAIFSEFFDGGSLESWISGGKINSLEQILDIAVQSARGLFIAHKMGVVHQDVKPANVLMKNSGIAAIGDFGMSGVKQTDSLVREYGSQSVLVTAGGFTPAYCSPEQTRQKKIDHRSDIWSWGLTVLSMFTGGSKWPLGIAAPAILSDFMVKRNATAPIPIPEELADLLGKCFKPDPEERWTDFREIADALQELYHRRIGKKYSRQFQDVSDPRDAHSCSGNINRKWKDPRDWLNKIDVPDTQLRHNLEVNSLEALALNDLELLEYIIDACRKSISEGKDHLIIQLASMFNHKAVIHQALKDDYGALDSYRKSIDLLDGILPDNSGPEVVSRYITAIMNSAIMLSQIGRIAEAEQQYDRVIRTIENRISGNKDPDLLAALSRVYSNKAILRINRHDFENALRWTQKVIEIREQIVRIDAGDNRMEELALSYIYKATLFDRMRRCAESIPLFEKSISIFRKLQNQEMNLATAYHNKAIALRSLSAFPEALRNLDETIRICSRFPENMHGFDYVFIKLLALFNKTLVLSMMGNQKDASETIETVIVDLTRLIYRQGRADLSYFLAQAYLRKISILIPTGPHANIRTLFDFVDDILIALSCNVEKYAEGFVQVLNRKIGVLFDISEKFKSEPDKVGLSAGELKMLIDNCLELLDSHSELFQLYTTIPEFVAELKKFGSVDLS